MKGLRLYKKEKLCSLRAIDALFVRDASIHKSTAIAFPLRAVWRRSDVREYCPQFLIMVPKRRLRHAVDRVAMRRRIREAYRLNRHLLPQERGVDIAFIYVAEKLMPYASVERSMCKLLKAIAESNCQTIEKCD